jgi:hypothetical protein
MHAQLNMTSEYECVWHMISTCGYPNNASEFRAARVSECCVMCCHLELIPATGYHAQGKGKRVTGFTTCAIWIYQIDMSMTNECDLTVSMTYECDLNVIWSECDMSMTNESITRTHMNLTYDFIIWIWMHMFIVTMNMNVSSSIPSVCE